jgi:hypothetical protein
MPRRGPEYELQQQIAGMAKSQNSLAMMFGWDHFHVQPLMTKYGYRTGMIGTLAKGWPDLTMFRVREHELRIVLAELKSDRGYLTPDEKTTHAFLAPFVGRYARSVFSDFEPMIPVEWDGGLRPDVLSIELYVWKPRDFDVIAATLR